MLIFFSKILAIDLLFESNPLIDFKFSASALLSSASFQEELRCGLMDIFKITE
jgi:hypothetical protein